MSTPSSSQSLRHEALDPRGPPPAPRRIDVRALLGGAQILMIEHGDSRYVLRMTRNNKLILTK